MIQYLLLNSRTRIQLGQKVGEGGEGGIYSIPSRPDWVAKVYANSPDSRKVQKLTAMPGLVTDNLRKISAWPLDLLMDNRDKVAGFVMRKIEARKDIHELYSPKSRIQSFPEANYQFLVHVCANIARTFKVIHDHGHVIGDINHGSVLVGPNGLVSIIDCDSFQIDAGKTIFTCDVGVPLFTAPEIHGKSLRGFPRTQNHDLFGMAVMFFHLLCMGRHPFIGRYTGGGEMLPEKAISEFRFAYGQNREAYKMERPPGTPPLEALGASVRCLFEQAFSPAGAKNGRPDTKAWVLGLDELKARLRACSAANWHHYSNELKACPWCVVESQTSIRLFGECFISTNPTGTIDIKTLWSAITSVKQPDPDPPLPETQPWILPTDANIPDRTVKTVRKIIAIAAICIGFAGCCAVAKGGGGLIAILGVVVAGVFWPRVSSQRLAEAQQEVATAKLEYNSFLTRWKREASIEPVLSKYRDLEEAKTKLLDIPNERQRGLNKLKAKREANQRFRHLDGFRISRANIRYIGVSRKAVLASYGIETAADIDSTSILNIPGFGLAYKDSLVNWRRSIEQKFRFNPNEPIVPGEIAALDQKLASRSQTLVSTLQQGPNILRQSSQEIVASRKRLMPILYRAWITLKVAEAKQAAL